MTNNPTSPSSSDHRDGGIGTGVEAVVVEGRGANGSPLWPEAILPPSRPKQRLVILCDGTWQSRDKVEVSTTSTTTSVGSESDSFFSNIPLLARAIRPTGYSYEELDSSKGGGLLPKPINQLVYYQSGVGTTQGALLNAYQGATGAALSDKIEEAYSFLCDNFVEGDEIFLFGFSRGAYTARALSGFINWCGVLSKAQLRYFNEIWRAYQRRDPKDPETNREASEVLFKAIGFWPSEDATATASIMSKGVQGVPDSEQDLSKAWEEARREAEAQGVKRVVPPRIKAIGVFDTVKALGLPGFFSSKALTRFFDFYDPGLGSNVEHAFQALSLGEDRKDFLPTLWYQPRDRLETLRKGQVLRQCWFQGCHSDVGGSYNWHGLSDISLAWMVANLVDRPGGPMLEIDLDLLKRTQDRRRGWALQPPHPSRFFPLLQKARSFCDKTFSKQEMDEVVWKSMVRSGNTNETIHHSVTVGGHYDKRSSKVFSVLRRSDPARLDSLWSQAGSFDSLLPTERFLLWNQEDDSFNEGKDWNQVGGGSIEGGMWCRPNIVPQPDYKDGIFIDLVNPERSPNLFKVWKGFDQVVFVLPQRLVSSVVNLRWTPTENLKPSVLSQLWWRFGGVFAPSKKSSPVSSKAKKAKTKVNSSPPPLSALGATPTHPATSA